MRHRAPIPTAALSALALAGVGFAGCNDRQPIGEATVGTQPVRLAIDLGGHVTRLGPQRFPNDRVRVVVSPDGRWRAVVRTPAGNGGQGSVTLRRSMPGAPGHIVERHLMGDPHDVRWSHDSRWLAMLVWSPHLLSAVAVGTDGSRHVLASPSCGGVDQGLRADGSGRRALGYGFVTWAPKGDALAITRQELSLGRPSGPVRRLDVDVLPGLPAQFSPDGSLLAYWRWKAIIVRRVADRRVVLEVPMGSDVAPASTLRWASDGRSLLVTAGVYRD